jgi:hypothetical protein
MSERLAPIVAVRVGLIHGLRFETGDIRFSLHAIPDEIAKTIEVGSPRTACEAAPVKLIFEKAATRHALPLNRGVWQ